MKITVRVPATTANLGPGFDALGLALDLWNQTTFEVVDDAENAISIEGEGAGKLPANQTNAIFEAMRDVFELAGRTPHGIRIHCVNGVPLSSGLGSSSAAMLTGLLGANALAGYPFSDQEILRMATRNEGHPDNVAPAMLGGLVAATFVDDTVFARQIPLGLGDVAVTVVLPDFHFPTKMARAALPKHVPLRDAVHNISRAVLVAEAFRAGDLALLGAMMDDCLHQPYRFPLIPGAQSALDAARRAGAAAVALSGAGPSLVAFSSKREPGIGAGMAQAFESAGLPARIFELAISREGASIQVS